MWISNRKGVACETQVWVLGHRASLCVSHSFAAAVAADGAAWSRLLSGQKGFFVSHGE